MNNELIFIGEIKTPYKTPDDCPRNISSAGPLCEISVYDEFGDGLCGLQKSQKILVMYWLDLSKRSVNISKSHDGDEFLGTFAKRTPVRPNPIGVAVLEIADIIDNIITVNGLDCVNGTKLIDIKPAILFENEM